VYLKHFVSKLTDAEAELNETEHWIETAHKCKYLSSQSRDKLKNDCADIKRLIGGMILKAYSFVKTGK
jgi:four helix bundle protein